MRNATKIAGFGLAAGAAGAAVMLALSAPALARGAIGGMGVGAGWIGGPAGGLFTVHFADLDSDGDGLITEAELALRAEGLGTDALAFVDADGDGVVTAAELEAQIAGRLAALGETRAPGGQGADPAAMGKSLAKAMAERMLSARDADGDGGLSGTELMPAVDIARLIDRFDSDDDNAWSEAEFAASRIAGRGAPDGAGDRGARGGHAPFFRR